MSQGRALPLHRPLAVLAVLTGVLAVGLLPAMALDDRQLLGVSVWLKPWKFAVSIAIYSLTVAWMVTLVGTGARLARTAATLAAVALGVEMAIITVQAARGVPSHFNTQTPLDATLFNIMGASIITVWAATLALVLARQRLADRVLAILWPSRGPAQALVGLALLGLGLGNLFPMGLSVTVALAPDRAVLGSGRAVAMTSLAVLLAPLTVGTLADATSLRAALGVVPVALALAAAGLTLVRRARTPASPAPETADAPSRSQ